jgi:hypothetical protein
VSSSSVTEGEKMGLGIAVAAIAFAAVMWVVGQALPLFVWQGPTAIQQTPTPISRSVSAPVVQSAETRRAKADCRALDDPDLQRDYNEYQGYLAEMQSLSEEDPVDPYEGADECISPVNC